jgi:sulfite oxidase
LEITSENLPEPIRLTLEDLKKFPKYEVEATIQCAGNRRNEMHNYKAVKGGAWDIGAISNATWGGARLRDVLMAAGVDAKGCANGSCMVHAQFEGLDKDFEKNYGSSIPIEKAMAEDGDCVLAWEMNVRLTLLVIDTFVHVWKLSMLIWVYRDMIG